MVYRAKKTNIIPKNIQLLFKESHTLHNYNTIFSSKGNFDVNYVAMSAHCHKLVKAMYICINGVKLWNDLDQHIHEINSLV